MKTITANDFRTGAAFFKPVTGKKATVYYFYNGSWEKLATYSQDVAREVLNDPEIKKFYGELCAVNTETGETLDA